MLIQVDTSDNFILCIFISLELLVWGFFSFSSNSIRFVLNSKVSSYTSINQCSYIDLKDCSIFH